MKSFLSADKLCELTPIRGLCCIVLKPTTQQPAGQWLGLPRCRSIFGSSASRVLWVEHNSTGWNEKKATERREAKNEEVASCKAHP